MSDWKKIRERTESIGYRTLVFKTFTAPDGNIYEFTTYGRLGVQDVAVVALTADHKIVIACQFRQGPETTMYELPGGSVEPGESLEMAAQRELAEETGYQAERLEYLGHTIRDAYTNGSSHYFIGYGCTKVGEQQLDQAEFVDIIELGIDDVVQNAKNGTMTDSGGVFLAYDKLKDIQQGGDHE